MDTTPTQPLETPPKKETGSLSKDGHWRSFTRVPHLLQYVSSGTYYARVKVRGKIIRKSLDTDVFSTAKLKLIDFLKEQSERQHHGRMLLFQEAIDLYSARVKTDHSMKETSKHYRDICIAKIGSSWPEIKGLRLDQITHEACRDWANKLKEDIASQYFNNVIDTLRLVFEEGNEELVRGGGEALKNPAVGLARARITAKILQLPEKDQFSAIIDHVRNGSSWGPKAADLLEFLAYGGMRLYTEAQWVTWGDIDWKRKEIIVRGDPVTHTKNWEIRRVPILPNMAELLGRMQASRTPPPQPTEKVMEVTECPVSLHKACNQLGIHRLRHHDFRHLFATRCIESGVDIPTVSRWLGHKDGGALAMKTYGHLRNEHSQAMAQKVKF
ncbi:MAG: site-specific integrase [Verrucomicrobiota bacterium]